MTVYPNQLAAHLAGALAPIYLLSGDEPLLLMEAADAVRRAARDQGYEERVVLDADKRFDWRELSAQASSQSLFAQRRVLDLRLASCRLGKEGGDALRQYAQRPAEDTLLLVTAPRLDSAAQRSVGFKALADQGVAVRLWPPERKAFAQWLEQRLRARGLRPERDAVHLLAERVEGNLLAAAQEVDKLALLFGAGAIDADAVIQGVTDSARFDVYGLIDSALHNLSLPQPLLISQHLAINFSYRFFVLFLVRCLLPPIYILVLSMLAFNFYKYWNMIISIVIIHNYLF